MSNLTQIKRQSVEKVLAGLTAEAQGDSRTAGEVLINRAKDSGLNMRDYLTYAIDPRQTEDESRRNQVMEAKLDGYEVAKLVLNLPVADDFESGVLLQAASDTFQTFPGTRALFPEVVDDMLQFKYKQDTFERVEPMLAQSRTINGVELLSYVIADKASDYDVAGAIPETANIPVSSIRTGQQSVSIYKHGMGYRTSYEFERRARLDMLTPYANRAQRAMELSRVAFATNVLINGHAMTTTTGDIVYGAAPEVDQSSLNTRAGVTATNGKISWQNLLVWLVDRAKAGTPVDTVLGNWDAYLQWLMLFSIPTTNNTGQTSSQFLSAAGFQMGQVSLLQGAVNFVLSSSAPANKLVGFSRGDTLEELVESGSLIQESERSVRNQTISYFRTMNTGYRLVHGDTRSVYDFGN